MIFLDNASTTQVYDDTLEVYCKYSKELFFNPSAPYKCANDIKSTIDKATKDILKFLNGEANSKLIYTSCATESNNTVLLNQLNKRYKKILISIGEHSSIYNLMQEVKNKGYEIQTINLTKDGTVDIEDFKNKMDNEVGLVSIMHVSNETGAINPIKELVKIAKSINPNCIFHCDGVQAMCKIKVDLKDLGVDMYTFSGHKIHAPKGIAGLYTKIDIHPYLIGGGQQSSLRAGTENVSGIMALHYAIVNTDIDSNFKKVSELFDYVCTTLSGREGIKINTNNNSSHYIVSISLSGVNGATVVNMLDECGICIGTGSACSTKKAGNTTLTAMGISSSNILGSIRVSFCEKNTIEEVKEFCDKLLEVYDKLKKMLGKK